MSLFNNQFNVYNPLNWLFISLMKVAVMGYEVKIIKDSITRVDRRLTTITASYPRIIHSEIMTHRDRARNAASSRAIPWSRMKGMVITEPFVPMSYGLEQKGMQAGDQIHPDLKAYADLLWLRARDAAVDYADMIHNIGASYALETGNNAHEGVKIHKSIPNRLIEPFAWITVVMTATEWKNFFRLRCHPDAEIHFQKIAGMIRDAMAESKPQLLEDGQWHLPFISEEDIASNIADEDLLKMSVARCSRVSYMNQDKTPTVEDDLLQFERLVTGSGFGHWSAHEHIAQATLDPLFRSGPFIGYRQYRKTFAMENLPG